MIVEIEIDDPGQCVPSDRNTVNRVAIGNLHRWSSTTILRHNKYILLSRLNTERAKLPQAQRCMERAIYIAINLYGAGHLQVSMDLELLGCLLYERGLFHAAEPLMARSRRIKRTFELDELEQ